MAKEPIVVFSIALGHEAMRLARQCRTTFKAFHPTIPFFIIDRELYPWFVRQNFVGGAGEMMSMRSIMGGVLAEDYERVIYLDADILVLGPLNALIDSKSPLTTTNDIGCSYGLNEPLINAGVVAASGPEFWRAWQRRIYSQVVPILPNFLDQLCLRQLCGDKEIPFELLAEKENKEYYNVSVRNHPGDYRLEQEILYKGDAVMKLWHFAGGIIEKDWRQYPVPMRTQIKNCLVQGRSFFDEKPENAMLRARLEGRDTAYINQTRAFFSKIGTTVQEGAKVGEPLLPNLFVSDAPACWDQFRKMEGTGLYRRTLPGIPRIIYARDPAHLNIPELEKGWDWHLYGGKSTLTLLYQEDEPLS